MSHAVRIALFGVVSLVSIGLGMWYGARTPNSDAVNPYAHIGGDFTLDSAAGPISLSDYKGKVVAIFFGYTHCPDVCPTSLSALAQAIKQLAPDEQDRVQGVFVSVDPERDTPERTGAYAAAFHPRFAGLTGSPEAIAEVAKRYLVLYEKVAMEDSAMGYAVDHSAIVYVLDRDGVVKTVVRHSDSPAKIAQTLREVLSG